MRTRVTRRFSRKRFVPSFGSILVYPVTMYRVRTVTSASKAKASHCPMPSPGTRQAVSTCPSTSIAGANDTVAPAASRPSGALALAPTESGTRVPTSAGDSWGSGVVVGTAVMRGDRVSVGRGAGVGTGALVDVGTPDGGTVAGAVRASPDATAVGAAGSAVLSGPADRRAEPNAPMPQQLSTAVSVSAMRIMRSRRSGPAGRLMMHPTRMVCRATCCDRQRRRTSTASLPTERARPWIRDSGNAHPQV